MSFRSILFAIMAMLFSFPAYSQTNIDNYINTIQQELKNDISNVERKASTSYYRPSEQPNKRDITAIKETGGNFAPYFKTINEYSNDSVKFFINYYSTYGKRKLENIIARLAQYFPVIKRYADEYNMPVEMAIIGFLNSEFHPNAQMSSDYVGIWNLSPSTAKIYGLDINDYLDERKDIEKATDVAFKYLSGLKEAFNGNWDFIITAYNGGGAFISQQIRENKISNFWDLIEKNKDFSNENLEYVPRFHAILTILKHSSRYNVDVPKFSDDYIQYDKVVASKTGVSFKDLSKLTNVPVNQLVAMNPQFTKQYTIRYANLYVPVRLARLAKSRISIAKAHKLRWISSGSTLSKNQYGVAYKSRSKNSGSSNRSKSGKYYSVKKKDTLTSIARRYNMSVSQLAKSNNMKPNSILKVGKVIKIASVTTATLSSGRRYVASSSKKEKVYNVKKGDTLFSIARKYNVAVNNIKTPSNTNFIRPGDKVSIR